MSAEDRLDRLEELSATAAELELAVDTLNRGLADVGKQARANRRRTVLTAVGLLLDVALTIALATVLSGQAETNQRVRESLAQNYITSQQQAQTRVKVLCPLYTVLLASVSDPNRATAMTPAQRAQVAAAVQVVRDGYTALGCLPALPG